MKIEVQDCLFRFSTDCKVNDCLDSYVSTIHGDILESAKPGAQVLGTISASLIHVGRADRDGVSLEEVCDNDSEALYEIYADLFRSGTSRLRTDLFSRHTILKNSLLYLHSVNIEPEYKGNRLGLIAASLLMQKFADSLVILAPLHEDDLREEFDDEVLLGFRPLRDTPYQYFNAKKWEARSPEDLMVG